MNVLLLGRWEHAADFDAAADRLEAVGCDVPRWWRRVGAASFTDDGDAEVFARGQRKQALAWIGGEMVERSDVVIIVFPCGAATHLMIGLALAERDRVLIGVGAPTTDEYFYAFFAHTAENLEAVVSTFVTKLAERNRQAARSRGDGR